MLRVKSHITIHASSAYVKNCYLDYGNWHLVFPATISAARLLQEEKGFLIIEVRHKKAGRVINILSMQSNGDIQLEEWKPLYEATFINHFDSIGNFTRYTVIGTIHLKGFYNLMAPFLRPIVRRRMRKYILEPMKIFAESQPKLENPRENPGGG